MRRVLSILLLTLSSVVAAPAQSLTVATWLVELPDAPPTNSAAAFAPYLERAAAVLKPLNADVILLHGIPSRSTTKQLSDLLKPASYLNPIFSSFLKDSPSTRTVSPVLTVLSKHAPPYSRTVAWRETGRLDIPGGFSFCIIQQPVEVLMFYTVQFPRVASWMTREMAASIPRRRELCARYIVAHQRWLFDSATHEHKAAYLATDLEVDQPGGTNDPACAVLLANGFKLAPGNRTLSASTAQSSTGWPAEGSLVSAFYKGAVTVGEPQSVEQRGFFAPVALVELGLKSPGSTPTNRPVAVAAARPPVKPAGKPAAGTNGSPASSSPAVAQAVGTPAPAKATNGTNGLAPALAAGGSAGKPPTNRVGLAAAAGPTTPPAQPADARRTERTDRAESDKSSRFDPRSLAVGAGVALVVLGAGIWALRRRRPLPEPPIVPAGTLGAGTPRPSGPVTARLVTMERARMGGPFQVLEHPAGGVEPDEGAGRGGMEEEIGHMRGRAARPPEDGGGRGPNPPFFQLLRERLVRWLAAERSQLLSSHHAGAEQVLELEERLTRIQNQFETRLRARDQRVVELEAELVAKEKMLVDLERALSRQLKRQSGPQEPPPSPPPS